MPDSRDLVVIGASAGGLQALFTILGALPPTLPAAVVVVVHTRSNGGVLPQVAALLAVGLARLMEPAVTVPVIFEGSAVLLLLAVAAIVGILSSLVALRRAVAVDPALAFGG